MEFSEVNGARGGGGYYSRITICFKQDVVFSAPSVLPSKVREPRQRAKTKRDLRETLERPERDLRET